MKKTLVILGIVVLSLLILILFPLWNGIRARKLNGPVSPTGTSVDIKLTDAARFNPGSDFYTSVRLTQRKPTWKGFYWSDQSGQQSMKGVTALIDSMKWISPNTLEFDTYDGISVRISLIDGLWALNEFKRTKSNQ